jgi:hypothetical protein
MRYTRRPGSVQKLVGLGRHRYDQSGDVELGVVNALGIAIDWDGHAQRGGCCRPKPAEPEPISLA